MNQYIWNNFKTKIRNMNKEEQEKLLKELQADLMYSKTRRFQEINSMRIKMLKRKIACLKTIMGVKGFGYNPR